MRSAVLAAATLLLLAPSANAAIILVDDSDANTMTFTWSGFDVTGFSMGVNAPSAAGTITVADGGYNWTGQWFDTQPLGGDTQFAYFALPSDLTGITSGFIANVGFDGQVASLANSSGGFTGFVYFFDALNTSVQDGHTEFRASLGSPGLQVTFISENANTEIPEPGTLTLFALGTLSLGALRRRPRAA